MGDLKLLFYTEAVKEVPAKDQRVLWGVDTMDPTGRNEEGVPGLEFDADAFVDEVSEKCLRLLAAQHPFFVPSQVVVGWSNEEEDLLSFQHVIPD